MSRVAVIGGGPAGIMAAAAAAGCGHDSVLLEKNEKLGKKLFLTGKGRCNITNSCDTDDFFANIPRNPKFLYSALYGFSNTDIVELINANGVPTKVERGKRIFPASDKSSDVIKALARHLNNSGAELRLNTEVSGIRKAGSGFELTVNGCREAFDAVILCTGGASYPTTGSTGAGYAFAKKLGHTVTDIRPSLIPLATVEEWPGKLAGLSLKNITLRAYNKKNRLVYEDLGEMLFTHFGVSGPLVLSDSAHLRNWEKETYRLSIDLKPALDEQKLESRILRDLGEAPNRSVERIFSGLVPHSMVPVILNRLGMDPQQQANAVTREQRRALVQLLKHFTMPVTGPRPVAEAIITSGGVKVGQVQPATMASKLVQGLYFAGEILDVDAYTGGFNLQIAWATGHCAGVSAAEE